MAKAPKDNRPQARLPKGFQDLAGEELRTTTRMLGVIREVYERYGYEPLETPAFEYTDALGKFLPDQDRPNAGVFSLVDEDEQWMSLRYDMTAPLARYVAENKLSIPTPYRRYTMGPVWRNEKPGPGRFRQFMQCDADTVGTESVAADAEACMLMADVIEALGIQRGDCVVKVNNRKILDGLRQAVGLAGEANAERWLNVMRSLDKFDRLGKEGVRDLLGSKGRIDASGDKMPGLGLSEAVCNVLVQVLDLRVHADALQESGKRSFNPNLNTSFRGGDIVVRALTQTIAKAVSEYCEKHSSKDGSELSTLAQGLKEIEEIGDLIASAGYGDGRVIFDPSVVRGLDYYTGPVFEAELTFQVKNEDGETVRFGSVGGGGRYDDLVARFTGQRVPATGFSLGLSRLQSALAIVNKGQSATLGPVVVMVMDRAELPRYQKMAHQLRSAGIRAEMYLGTSGMKAQMKYADKRGAPCVIIQGSDERAKGEVQIKDLIEGAKAAAAIKDNAEWKATRPAQISVSEDKLVASVRDILARHGG